MVDKKGGCFVSTWYVYMYVCLWVFVYVYGCWYVLVYGCWCEYNMCMYMGVYIDVGVSIILCVCIVKKSICMLK